jgi:hypothetical protein
MLQRSAGNQEVGRLLRPVPAESLVSAAESLVSTPAAARDPATIVETADVGLPRAARRAPRLMRRLAALIGRAVGPPGSGLVP